MYDIELSLNERGRGAFVAREGDDKLGEMVVNISGNHLTVYHTEVVPRAEGRGPAKQMLETMVSYARKNNLKVIPLCPYVHAQFKRHPEWYEDIWLKQKANE